MKSSQGITENPPSYDTATQDGDGKGYSDRALDKKNGPVVAPPKQAPMNGAGPSYRPPPAMMYHYVDPQTHHQITSFLPPDHPEMICLQEGRHIQETKFGLLGILAAVFWFPLGVGLCLLDRRIKCRRCGTIIDGGLSC